MLPLVDNVLYGNNTFHTLSPRFRVATIDNVNDIDANICHNIVSKTHIFVRAFVAYTCMSKKKKNIFMCSTNHH
jgi:hypothetical protein